MGLVQRLVVAFAVSRIYITSLASNSVVLHKH